MKPLSFPTVFGGLVVVLILGSQSAAAQKPETLTISRSLESATPIQALDPESFKNPPSAAKPTIWWFWGESVTTEHGITQDLEALKRVGYGGVVLYEQVFSDASDAYKSLSPEFLARVRFAAAECARLGLSLELNVGPGYVAGGPWITPELGLQRLVSSELQIDGGKKFSGALSKPPTRLGFYRDVAVLAYPSPAGTESVPPPTLTCEPAGLDLATLFTRDGKKVRIPASSKGQSARIQIDYGKPFTARSISFSQRTNAKGLIVATQLPGNWSDDNYGENVRPHPPLGQLEASEDGTHWDAVCTLPQRGFQLDGRDRQTLAFPAKTARFFRLNLHDWGHNTRFNDDDLHLGGVELIGEARVDQWEVKSANVIDFADPDKTPAYAGNEVIDPAKIVDLTNLLSPEGKLDWDVPAGRWTILRFGHTATGAIVKHGRPESKGLECDKMSAKAAQVQFENYVGRILKEVRTVPGARLAGINIDSAETGSQNWTADFAVQFQARRGYDLRRFLPTMAGRVVGSVEQSDRFLTDVRRTCADLIADLYFGEFQRLCHANNMTVMAQTGIATPLPMDDIQAKGHTDIPMCEFWMSQSDGTLDCKETSSAAHVYGLPIVAAEAFTGSTADVTLARFKPLADNALALGVNRFVVLAYIHQPWDDRKPGVTEDRYYLPSQRHNTWWEYSGSFWNTLSRSSYMMQQGKPVMDLLYYLGNDVPQKIAPSRMRPAPPEGYDYDVCGDEILTRASVKNGRVVLPSGMSYRVLVLAGGDRLTLAAARQLRALVTQGAVVLAATKPVGSRSLADGALGDAEVRKIADELWGSGDQPGSAGEHATGKGKVIWGRTPAEVLDGLGLSKDFEATPTKAEQKILFAHRRSGTDDIYFVANHRAEPVTFIGRFRVQRKIPQAWNPETGQITALPGFTAKQDRIEVPLALEAHGSLFTVFRDEPAPKTNAASLIGGIPVWKTLSGSWQIGFLPNAGAPEQLTFPALISWPEHSDPGVRNYSGTATYRQEFDLSTVPTEKVILDLGRVEALASVTLNGIDLGVVWKTPFAVDVTKALRVGKNQLEVKVVNVWTNRLIADAGLPESKRVSWATYNPYKPNDPLLPSGLLGPVVLRSAAK